jgi:hypothetical protein
MIAIRITAMKDEQKQICNCFTCLCRLTRCGNTYDGSVVGLICGMGDCDVNGVRSFAIVSMDYFNII